MKRGLTLTLVTMFCCLGLTQAQDNAESIRNVLETERQAIAKRDSTAFFALMNETPDFSVISMGNGYYQTYNLKAVHSTIARNWKQPLKGRGNTLKHSDIKSHIVGDRAITEFVEMSLDSNNKTLRQTLETWTLSKNNGSWKIDKILSVDTSSFNPTKPISDLALEQELNNVGYRLLSAKKNDHAIRLLKMNVELFPKAWNTYDSLGEAYMINGNKKEAIENYEHSLKLNPQNTIGKEALNKLKTGK